MNRYLLAVAVVLATMVPAVGNVVGRQALDVEGHKLVVRRDGPSGFTVLLDGRVMLRDESDEAISLLGPYVGQGRRYVLVEGHPKGSGCDAKYKAVDLAFPNVVVTPVFGDCAVVKTVLVENGVLQIAFVDRNDRYTFAYGVITHVSDDRPHEAKASPGPRFTTPPNGLRRLYYQGPNTIGPTLLGSTAAQIVDWPPKLVTIPDPTVRGLALGIPMQDAKSIAAAIPMQPDDANSELGVMTFYEGLGQRAPSVMGQPNVARLDCSPGAMGQIGLLGSFKRQLYQSCLQIKPSGSAPVVSAITSIQQLDPAITMVTALQALVGKYGPPSQQTADNEMIWFAKDATGTIVAIDGLFTDFTASQNYTASPGSFVPGSGGPITKILEIDMTYYEPKAEKLAPVPHEPKL